MVESPVTCPEALMAMPTRRAPQRAEVSNPKGYRPGRPRGERERHAQGADQRGTNLRVFIEAPSRAVKVCRLLTVGSDN